jgi:cysteine-rich repeat protein
VCGDGIVGNTPGETYDPPGSPAGGNGQFCRADCTVCGDAIMQGNEQCDDDNGVNTDGCRNNCTPPFCGDGILDADETCDPPGPPAGASGNICRHDYTVCGDSEHHGGGHRLRRRELRESHCGCLPLICGEKIDSPDSNPANGTMDVNDAASSTEALCVFVRGSRSFSWRDS